MVLTVILLILMQIILLLIRKIKEKITGQTGDDGTKNVEIIVLLK